MPSPPVLAVTPTGRYSLPIVRCAQLLASCAEVRTMLGVATAALALDAIDYPARDTESYGEPLPGIVLFGRQQRSGYSGDQAGEVVIALYDNIDPAYAVGLSQEMDIKNDAALWLNRCGAIVSQFLQASKRPMADFGGERFDALEWNDLVYPVHDYSELADDQPAVWFRFAAAAVRWTT